MDTIEKVVYINLDKRPDRKILVERELLRVFPYDKIVRFAGINNSIGYIGCTLSHIGALQVAKHNNWKNVLIVEDDLEWCNFTRENLNIFENLCKNSYDVIMLGGAFIYYNKTTYKLKSAATGHCYLVSNHYYDKLISNLNEGLKNLIETSNSKFANDQYWKALQKTDSWYIVVPCIATQSEGFSDNGGVRTNLKSLIGKVIDDEADKIYVKPTNNSTHYFPRINEISENNLSLDKIVYISLEDCRKEILEKLEEFSLNPIQRFQAINSPSGYTLSHIAVLEMAMKEGWKNYLVVEDGIAWKNSNFNSLNKLTDYDVILLGSYNIDYNKETNKITNAESTTAYIVNQRYYKTLLANFKEGLFNLQITGKSKVYGIDQYWKALQKIDNWYFVDLCYQRESYNDIQKRLGNHKPQSGILNIIKR